jgi:hypothetical protein
VCVHSIAHSEILHQDPDTNGSGDEIDGGLEASIDCVIDHVVYSKDKRDKRHVFAEVWEVAC